MQAIQPAKPQTITINSVTYSGKDIAKAVVGAVPLKALTENEVVDLGDAVLLLNYEKTAVFKSEGKLRVVARGTGENKGYVLVNKHALKKTHAEYESSDRPPVMLRTEYERPRTQRRERSY